MNDILKIKSLTKSFPRVIANKDITFSIKKNSVHALLGENGAGKSTLVKILYGLLKADKGWGFVLPRLFQDLCLRFLGGQNQLIKFFY